MFFLQTEGKNIKNKSIKSHSILKYITCPFQDPKCFQTELELTSLMVSQMSQIISLFISKPIS